MYISRIRVLVVFLDVTLYYIMIHWCKKLKFDHTTKWYIHKPESVLVNEIHEILWEFKIRIDHPIPARRPNLVMIIKKKREITEELTLQSENR